jgi:hypothetical protein
MHGNSLLDPHFCLRNSETPQERRNAEHWHVNENSSVGLLLRSVIDRIESLKNTEVDSTELSEFMTQIRSLASLCSSKFMNDFPIVIVYMPIGNVHSEIKSWYCPNLNLTNIHEFIINAFEELERNSYNTHIETSNRCVDAICVLVDYINAVVLCKTDHYLEIQEKKLDELQPSKSVETSIQLLNGDEFYG